MARAHAVLRHWDEIVGEQLALKSRPDRYGKGTVWVAVTGSAWAQELRLRKETILSRLRERSGDANLFTDIRFGVRPIEPREPEVVVAPVVVEAPDEDLSIRDIAQRRLAKWRLEEGRLAEGRRVDGGDETVGPMGD